MILYNDSFYYQPVNPPLQLRPFRPSAVEFLFTYFYFPGPWPLEVCLLPGSHLGVDLTARAVADCRWLSTNKSAECGSGRGFSRWSWVWGSPSWSQLIILGPEEWRKLASWFLPLFRTICIVSASAEFDTHLLSMHQAITCHVRGTQKQDCSRDSPPPEGQSRQASRGDPHVINLNNGAWAVREINVGCHRSGEGMRLSLFTS